MWALGDYPAVATEVIADLGPVLVEAARSSPATGCWTSAAGSGNVAIPAAAAGATVVASDLTPELLEVGRRLAAEAGVELTWEVGDAEALPYADGEFDAVLSCVGVMFAPHHQAAADELVRVCRPGGTIGLIAWTPAGFIGQMFATMKPYAPRPRPEPSRRRCGATRPTSRALLGDRVERGPRRDPELTGAVVRHPGGVPGLLQDQLRTDHRGLPGDRRRPGEGRGPGRGLAELGRRFDRGSDSTVLDWEYLLLIARRR